MSGSVIPILGMLTKKRVIILGADAGTNYNRHDYNNFAVNTTTPNTTSGHHKTPPVYHGGATNMGNINTAPPTQNNTNPPPSGNNYPPPSNNVINPPVTTQPDTPIWPNSPGGEWTGDGWDNMGGGGGGGGAMDNQPQANQPAQPLGNDENGCPYYGIDQQGNKLYGKDANGKDITDPKMSPCYLQKKDITVVSKTNKADKWFMIIGIFIIGASVGFALYKSKRG